MNRTATRIASAVAAAAIPFTVIASPAQATTVYPYFLKNETASNHSINVWSTSSCSGSVHPVYIGEKIMSDGWDSARASYPWAELIYDDITGKYLGQRYHDAYDCVALSNNRHSVYVYNS